MKFCEIGILIPAFNPDEKIIKLLEDLINQSNFIQKITIVDDGSLDQKVFNQIASEYGENVVILHHNINRGKGQALKTGFKYISDKYTNITGIATIDADGQHKVTDLLHLQKYFMENSDNLVIGGRTFDDKVPLRSRFGNLLTSQLVNLLTGVQVQDTQTGLRIIPINYVKQLISFPSNHYEFEFDMLLATKSAGVKIVEIPIQTVYLDNNATSHFRVIHDSLAIYSRFLKFALSGIGSFVIDIISFYLLIYLLMSYSKEYILLATIIARLISGIFNYLVNKKLVFNVGRTRTFLKYVSLVIVQMLASGILTTVMSHAMNENQSPFWISLIKIIVDFLLFLISYQIQKSYVFKPVGDSNAT